MNLADLLSRAPRSAVQEQLALVAALAQAVQEGHRAGMQFAGWSPSRITILGESVDLSALDAAKGAAEHQAYTAPEVADGGAHSKRSDVYSAGVIIWSRMVDTYLMGRRGGRNDLMAWNADTTRMPYHMHREYLRTLYLKNDLAEGRYLVDDRPVALSDIRVPIFAVATVKDHVSPWRSVYKIHLLTDTPVTFVLTNGGHNAGIVSEPGHHGRQFQMTTRGNHEKYMPPEAWQAGAPASEGSWWPAWHGWLAARSGTPGKPPAPGAPEKGLPALGPAPGTYVLES